MKNKVGWFWFDRDSMWWLVPHLYFQLEGNTIVKVIKTPAFDYDNAHLRIDQDMGL